MTEQDMSPRPGITVLNAPVDTLSANGPFSLYLNSEQHCDFENERERLVRNQRHRIIVLRDGFQKSDGTTAMAGEPVSAIEAGGAANVAALEHRGWLSMIDIETVVRRQAALDARWLIDPHGAAVILPSGVTEPGSAVTEEMCAYVGDTRTIYDDNGNAKQVPMGPPTHDGAEVLRQLIAAGRVVPGPGHKGTSGKASKKVTAP